MWGALLNEDPTQEPPAAVATRRCCLQPLSPPAPLQALLRGSLRKAFAGFDLWMLGLGLVIGSGWAQLTGSAGQQYAGCGGQWGSDRPWGEHCRLGLLFAAFGDPPTPTLVLTGTHLTCRPAVIVSYLFAGLAALLSAVCFAELCTEFPVSGGAFSYIMARYAGLLRVQCWVGGWVGASKPLPVSWASTP